MNTNPEALYAAARELTTTDLLPRLKALIPEQTTTVESSIGSHTKHQAAPLPWNDPVAMLYYEIHGNARRWEANLTLRLYQRATFRPGTDEHTREALSRLPVLLEHGHAQGLDPELDLAEPTRDLLGWPAKIRRILDESLPGEEPTMRVPGDARCPYCTEPLTLGAGWKALAENATAVCRRCKDAHGKSLTWPITERIGHLQRDEQVTAAVAQQRYGIRQATFASWKRRGRIHPFGRDEQARDTYRVSDILALVDTPNEEDVAS